MRDHELLHPFHAPAVTYDRTLLVSLWLFAAWAIATGAVVVAGYVFL